MENKPEVGFISIDVQRSFCDDPLCDMSGSIGPKLSAIQELALRACLQEVQPSNTQTEYVGT